MHPWCTLWCSKAVCSSGLCISGIRHNERCESPYHSHRTSSDQETLIWRGWTRGRKSWVAWRSWIWSWMYLCSDQGWCCIDPLQPWLFVFDSWKCQHPKNKIDQRENTKQKWHTWSDSFCHVPVGQQAPYCLSSLSWPFPVGLFCLGGLQVKQQKCVISITCCHLGCTGWQTSALKGLNGLTVIAQPRKVSVQLRIKSGPSETNWAFADWVWWARI